MHRIRRVIGARDGLYQLKYSAVFLICHSNMGDLKRGKGSQKNQNVGVMTESTPLKDINTGKNSGHTKHFKMKVLSTHKSAEVNQPI